RTQPRPEKHRPAPPYGTADRAGERGREQQEPRDELDHRAAAVVADAHGSKAGTSRAREWDHRSEVERDELHPKSPERLRHEREETEREGHDVAEEDRARDGTQLVVPAIAECTDVDGERDEEEPEQSRGRGHQCDVEVVP